MEVRSYRLYFNLFSEFLAMSETVRCEEDSAKLCENMEAEHYCDIRWLSHAKCFTGYLRMKKK